MLDGKEGMWAASPRSKDYFIQLRNLCGRYSFNAFCKVTPYSRNQMQTFDLFYNIRKCRSRKISKQVFFKVTTKTVTLKSKCETDCFQLVSVFDKHSALFQL